MLSPEFAALLLDLAAPGALFDLRTDVEARAEAMLDTLEAAGFHNPLGPGAFHPPDPEESPAAESAGTSPPGSRCTGPACASAESLPGSPPSRFSACAPAAPAGRCAPAVPRLLALLLLASAGCHRFPDDTPVDAYRSLLSAVQRDDEARTLALLSEKSRTALTARAEELARTSGGTLRPTPVDLLLAEPRPPDPAQVSVRSDDGRTAVLAVTAHGAVQEVHLVREAGHWRVSIPVLETSGDG